jgi:hypothetical protein
LLLLILRQQEIASISKQLSRLSITSNLLFHYRHTRAPRARGEFNSRENNWRDPPQSRLKGRRRGEGGGRGRDNGYPGEHLREQCSSGNSSANMVQPRAAIHVPIAESSVRWCPNPIKNRRTWSRIVEHDRQSPDVIEIRWIRSRIGENNQSSANPIDNRDAQNAAWKFRVCRDKLIEWKNKGNYWKQGRLSIEGKSICKYRNMMEINSDPIQWRVYLPCTGAGNHKRTLCPFRLLLARKYIKPGTYRGGGSRDGGKEVRNFLQIFSSRRQPAITAARRWSGRSFIKVARLRPLNNT